MSECSRWIPLLLLLLLLALPLALGQTGSDKLLKWRKNRRALQSSWSDAMAANGTTTEDPLMDVDPIMAEIAYEKAQRVAADDPNAIAFEVRKAIYDSTYNHKPDPAKRTTGNPIDDCWRSDRHWYNNRYKLADCAIGFGRNARGGRDGKIYTVTDPDNDDPETPIYGTLRWGVLQDEPLWIVFGSDMVITLKQELIMTSYKTIDGRGFRVEIAYGGCPVLQYITNVIIHGVIIHDCIQTGPAIVRSNSSHIGHRGKTDGDAISIFASSNVWVDHCTLYRCRDGLIDAVHTSTAITISNNLLQSHSKVMVMGHNDTHTRDKIMQVTIAFNHFGEGLVQRIPRGRLGFFHLISNVYAQWLKYAIGGSANPTMKSEANRFIAPDDRFKKHVTKRMNQPVSEWMKWDWTSSDDLFENGAFFTTSGVDNSPDCNDPSKTIECYQISNWVNQLTANAGSILCRVGDWC